MSLALCKALSALSLSLWKTSTVRAFSSSLVQHTNANHTSSSTKEITVADKENEARERKTAHNKKWYLRLKDDPERFALRRQNRRERVESHRKDLSWRDRRALAFRSWSHRRRDEDPIAFSEYARERRAAYQPKISGSISAKARARLVSWTKHSWVRQLPWKSHTPIVTQDKVRHICATCDIYRIDGAKLWWRRHNPSDPPLYDCQSCYVKNFQHRPEGYEDVTTYKELKARKEELDNLTNKQTRILSDTEYDKLKD